MSEYTGILILVSVRLRSRRSRLYRGEQYLHVRQIEVFDEKGSKLRPVGATIHPQYKKIMHHGPQFLYDGHFDEVDIKGVNGLLSYSCLY